MTFNRFLLFAAAMIFAVAPLLAAGPDKAGHGPDRSWEGFAERHDANGDGVVTQEELEARHFERMDADGDGVLTAEDFAARRAEHVLALLAHRADGDDDGAITGAEWDAWFAAHDTDGNGQIDATDHQALMERHRAQKADQADRAGTEQSTRRRQGKSGDEAEGQQGTHRRRMHRGAVRSFAALDTDDDGAVTRAELDAFTAGFDTDGDGILAADELPEMRGHGRRGWHGRHGHREQGGPDDKRSHGGQGGHDG